jgi:outer membrane receptor for ferric coprogen and ferric-rhodotorulic acid
VSVIDHERIEQQNLFSLDEVMQQATGVTVQPFQLLTTAYYVRGFKINSFELDGVPAMLGETAGSPQDMAVYERVEILRGSNGLLHGSGNPAATVNLVRKRPQKAFAASTTLSGGTWDRYRGEVDVGGPLTPDWQRAWACGGGLRGSRLLLRCRQARHPVALRHYRIRPEPRHPC